MTYVPAIIDDDMIAAFFYLGSYGKGPSVLPISCKVLTSSLRTPKVFVKEFCYFLMSCHQHCLGINLLVQR